LFSLSVLHCLKKKIISHISLFVLFYCLFQEEKFIQNIQQLGREITQILSAYFYSISISEELIETKW